MDMHGNISIPLSVSYIDTGSGIDIDILENKFDMSSSVTAAWQSAPVLSSVVTLFHYLESISGFPGSLPEERILRAGSVQPG